MSKKDASTRPTIETITPLPAPGFKSNGAETGSSGSRHGLKLLALLGALIFLLVGGGLLLLYLSRNPLSTQEAASVPPPVPAQVRQKPAEPLEKLPEQAEQALEVIDPQILAAEKRAAEDKLADFLAARKKLDARGAADWGESTYAEIINSGRAADDALMNREFKSAAAQYGRAASMAADLINRSPEVLSRLIDEGQAALGTGNGDLARQKFTTALKIDPASKDARQGLKRSETIAAVVGLIASGNRHETGAPDIPRLLWC